MKKIFSIVAILSLVSFNVFAEGETEASCQAKANPGRKIASQPKAPSTAQETVKPAASQESL